MQVKREKIQTRCNECRKTRRVDMKTRLCKECYLGIEQKRECPPALLTFMASDARRLGLKRTQRFKVKLPTGTNIDVMVEVIGNLEG